MSFLNRESTNRGPEDVELVPGGGIAVVRCVAREDNPPAVQHPDEIVVIKTGGTNPGEIVTEALQPGAFYLGLTPSNGASDLVAVTSSRAVLIGQNHDGPESGWRTCIDVLDLTGTYGTTSYGSAGPQVLKSFDFSASGGANDVAITPDGGWAVVNSRNRIDVIDLDTDAPIGTVPSPTLALTVNNGPSDPSFLRDSIVMTRDVAGNSKAVVLTKRLSGSVGRATVYILSFSSASAPIAGPALELDPNNQGVDHSPHDIGLSPDDRLAFVTAKSGVALVDINAGALISHTSTQAASLRGYNDMIDSVVLSSTQAVTIAKTAIDTSCGEFGWRVDVFDIAPLPTGLTHRQGIVNTCGGYPHDLSMGPAGDVVAVRTMQHIVVLEGVDQTGAPVTQSAVPSASKPLQRAFNNNSDSVVISPSWLTFGLPGGTPSGGVVQYVIALADDPGTTPSGTRVDVVNIKDGSLGVDHSELVFDPAWPSPGVIPGKVELARSGRAVLVHSRAIPDSLQDAQLVYPNYVEASGEDVVYLSLSYPIGIVSTYEGWGHLEASSDSLAVERQIAVLISNLVPGDSGFIQTMSVQ